MARKTQQGRGPKGPFARIAFGMIDPKVKTREYKPAAELKAYMDGLADADGYAHHNVLEYYEGLKP